MCRGASGCCSVSNYVHLSHHAYVDIMLLDNYIIRSGIDTVALCRRMDMAMVLLGALADRMRLSGMHVQYDRAS